MSEPRKDEFERPRVLPPAGRASRICTFPNACAYPRCGCHLLSGKGHDYAWDVGNLHVIDYRLWLAALPIRRPGFAAPALHFSPADWSRP